MQFSVIIPCFNAGKYIDEALQSVAAQTVTPLEIIVIDDGSTDDSRQRAIASGAVVLTTPRLGGAGARNVGAERARAKWLAFLDVDDIWYPNHLQRAADVLTHSDDDVGFINHFDTLAIGGSRIPRIPQITLGVPTSNLTGQDYVEFYARNGSFAGMSACMVRRDAFAKIGGFNPYYIRRHDIEMWLRLVARGTWTYDPIPSSAYRSGTPGSISSSLSNRELYRLEAILENAHYFSGPAITQIIQRTARRTVSSAITDGQLEDLQQAFAMAWSHLAASDQVIFGVARHVPSIFRGLNKLRRRFVRNNS